MKPSIERQRQFIAIKNQHKPISELTNEELKLIRIETGNMAEYFQVEEELKRRGKIKQTFSDKLYKMTGSKIIIEEA
jgi:hypothetical protein